MTTAAIKSTSQSTAGPHTDKNMLLPIHRKENICDAEAMATRRETTRNGTMVFMRSLCPRGRSEPRSRLRGLRVISTGPRLVGRQGDAVLLSFVSCLLTFVAPQLPGRTAAAHPSQPLLGRQLARPFQVSADHGHQHRGRDGAHGHTECSHEPDKGRREDSAVGPSS